jgi:hypothetical protein
VKILPRAPRGGVVTGFLVGAILLLSCRATTSRPTYLPVPTAAVAEVELGIVEATRALAEGLAVDSIALRKIKESDGFIDSGWLDARTLEHTGARPLGKDVVRVRAWVNPAKQFWSELEVEAVYRPLADPSLPERELDVPLPDDHPLQRRIAGVIRKMIVLYGDADALKEFETRPANKLMADSTARADSLKLHPESLRVKPGVLKPDSLRAKPDTVKAKPDTVRVKPDTVKPKPVPTKPTKP